MNAQQLFDALIRLKEAGSRLKELQMVVRVHRPGSLGPLPSVQVDTLQQGFDWDKGKLLLTTAAPLTQLTPEEAQTITKSTRDGQSWHSLQLHQENERLKAENARLLTELEVAKRK